MDVRIRTGAKRLLETMPLLDGLFRRFIWSHRHFPEAEMAFLHSLPPGSVDVAVDVGAAKGGYAWLLDRVSNQVIAFEPGAWHFDYLSGLLFGTNIKLVNAALGACAGEAELYTAGDNEHARHAATLNIRNPVARSSGARVDKVSQTSLDVYLATALAADSRIDIIKIDVEGYENQVLLGAAKTVETHRPLLICEIEERHNPEYIYVFETLRSMGYGCFVFRNQRYEEFSGNRIEDVQRAADLAVRLSAEYNPDENTYINNFVFQHPSSRIKVVK
jgi:FkbM family methyltransferase